MTNLELVSTRSKTGRANDAYSLLMVCSIEYMRFLIVNSLFLISDVNFVIVVRVFVWLEICRIGHGTYPVDEA